jgi:hypothetical protein
MLAGLGLAIGSRTVFVLQLSARSDRSDDDLVNPSDHVRLAVAAPDNDDVPAYLLPMMKALVVVEAAGEALTVLGAGGVAAFSNSRQLRRRAATAVGAAAYALSQARHTRTQYLVFWRGLRTAGGGPIDLYVEIVSAVGGTIAVVNQIVPVVRYLIDRRRGRRRRDRRPDRGYL